MKLYQYVGSNEIKQKVAAFPVGLKIESVCDLEAWIYQNRHKPNALELIAATFVVDCEGYLPIADRHSEHIACAGGKPVFSAGEIFFAYGDRGLEVTEISNQSTGFCPEPESWLQVATSLDRIPISHPGRFTVEFIFRRCPACGQINIVKDLLFFCSVCGIDLPTIWNLD